jgi:glycosyltransferase involved in cell wall biosynthesis
MVARIAPELAARVAVNPFAVEIPPAADPSREEDGLVTFVGHFLHAPNVDAARWLVAEIMPRLRARRSNTRLRIVGADPLGMVRGLAAADVDVAGFVPDIGSELARASVVAAPVRTGGGQRMKVLHSMALGKAVVTTMRGAEGLLLEGEPGALATADTADAIAAAIAALLDAPEARRCMGRRARALVSERHSVAAYARRLDAAYAEVRNARR